MLKKDVSHQWLIKEPGTKGLRVVIRNMSRKSGKICTKTWHLVFFVFLPCSRNFLSTVFGIFGKFRINIVKNKFEKTFFQNEKKICAKNQKK